MGTYFSDEAAVRLRVQTSELKKHTNLPPLKKDSFERQKEETNESL